VTKTTRSERSRPVEGAVYPATLEGFAAMLENANSSHEEGYQLHSIVRLDNSIAVIYMRTATKPKPSGASFFG